MEVGREADEAQEGEEFRYLTPEEIKARMRQSIIELIRKEPQIAIAAAQSFGWQVIPAYALLSQRDSYTLVGK